MDSTSGLTAQSRRGWPWTSTPRWSIRVLREVGGLEAAGVTMEAKRAGVAFHYRRAPDEAVAVAEIERAIESAEAARFFQRIEGRKVIELRPKVEASKGTAARRLAHRLGVRGIICLGDDRTDVDMFQAVSALEKEAIEARSVAVMSPEIHPDVLAAADYSVNGVGGVEWLLGRTGRGHHVDSCMRS